MLINSFYLNFNSSASGSGIKLLLGNELPETVELNVFYAIPKVEVSKSYFSENEPSPQEGIIWIRTCSTDAVETIFTSDSEPQLVYGIVEAQQYYNDAWHIIDFYIGREENWEKISSFAVSVSHTGDMVESEITDGENTYRLFTITSSGTLTISDPTSGDVWLCGGGANGSSSGGGAGAYAASTSQEKLSGEYVVVIGSAQSASSVGSLLSVNAVSGSNGGTGGGSWGGGSGDGQSKYPFGNTTFKCHCAGGGSGGRGSPGGGEARYYGGRGGTNGGNGGSFSESGDDKYPSGGSGGTYGGGYGGSGSDSSTGGNGGSASFYGSGGGGAGRGQYNYGSSGSGYQGVCYIRIKK